MMEAEKSQTVEELEQVRKELRGTQEDIKKKVNQLT
jgi:hypothetical protein